MMRAAREARGQECWASGTPASDSVAPKRRKLRLLLGRSVAPWPGCESRGRTGTYGRDCEFGCDELLGFQGLYGFLFWCLK